MRFKTGQALRSAVMKISWISNFSKDDSVKKSLPLSIKRKLSILLNLPFPPVSFSGVFLTLKCETLVLYTHRMSCLTFEDICLGGVFLGESKNGFVISDHTDSSLPKKLKILKRIIYHDNGMSSCSSWKKKNNNNNNNKLILTAKARKKQHKLRMNIRNVYISVWNRNVSRIGYTLHRIVKL